MIDHTQVITRNPAAANITYIDPPSDLTVSCSDTSSYLAPLSYWDGTAVLGTVTPTVSGSRDACGGLLEVVWSVALASGQSLAHVINVTVDPGMPIAWIDPPASATINCGEGDQVLQPLAYSNGEVGLCEQAGQVIPLILTGSLDSCGSVTVLQWQATDSCGITIQHTQAVTVSNPVSTSTITTLDIAIYPNPAIDILYWESGNKRDLRFSLYDLYGRQVIQPMQNTEIDVSSVNAGLYLAKIESKDGRRSQTRKVVIGK